VRQEEQELHGLLPPWSLLAALAQAGLPTLLLAHYASEGDNLPDALHLGGACLRLLGQLGAVDLEAAAGQLPPRSATASPAAVGEASMQLEGMQLDTGLAAAAGRAGGGAAGQPPLRLVAPPSWVGLYGRGFDRSLF
jgi:hypothetical protein